MYSPASHDPYGASLLSKRGALWTLLAIGGFLVGALFLDIYVDWVHQGDPLWSTIVESLIPFLLALTLFYLGWRLYQRADDPTFLTAAAMWCLVGCAATIVLSGLAVGVQAFQEEIKLHVVVLHLATVGAVGGLLIGLSIARMNASERAAREERDRLENLFKGLPAPVVHGTFEGDRLTINAVNHAFEEVFGHAATEIEETDLYELVVPDEKRDEAAEIARKALEQGLTETQVRRLTTDGRRDFHLRVAPALNHGASETYAVYTDITEQKQRESELRLFKETVEQASSAVLVTEARPIDEPGPRIVYTNSAFKEMTGYSREEVIGKTPRILQGPETDREVLDSLREALENGESWSGETTNYRKDGTPFFLRWSVAPVRNGGGEIEYWMSVQRDVTEQRRRKKALRRQRNLLEQTQRLAGAWEADLSAGEMTWSEEVYRIHEVKPGTEISIEEGIDFYTSEAQSTIRKAFRRCIDEGTPYDLELPIVTAEGNRRWIRTVGAPAENEDGAVVKVAGAFQDITQRKQAEEALRKRETQLRGLTNSVPGVVFQAYARPGPEYGFYHVSEHAEALLGIPRDPSDFFERCIRRVPDPEQERLMDVINEAVDAGEHLEFEAPFVTPSGETLWLLGTAMPEPRDDELVYNGVILDITQRKRAENALQEQEARLRGLANSIPGVVYQFFARPDGTYGNHFVSEHAESVLGISADPEGFFERCVENVPASHREEMIQSVETAIQHREPWQFEVPFKTPTGERLWLLGTSMPEERDDQLVYNGVILDITERKRQEREAKRRADAMEAAADGMAILDGEGTYTYVNQAHADIYGYDSPEAFLGKTWKVCYEKEELRRFEEEIMPTLRENGQWRGRATGHRADGSTFPQEVTLNMLEGGGLVCVVRDITDQTNRERELQEARDEAEEASRLKSAMLANMSHELRTPLTSITGFSEMLKESLEGVLEAQATKIYEGSIRLQRTLESVLHLSQLEAGVEGLEQEHLSLGEVAQGVVEMLNREAAEKALVLTTELAPEAVVGYWNEDAVHRICRNLVENAIKFTPEGGRVEVRVNRGDGEALLHVEDTGIGMDPDHVPELFRAFRQESEGLRREYEGTGLGLSIVKRLTEELGGTVEVDTEKGAGSCFTVRLPLS